MASSCAEAMSAKNTLNIYSLTPFLILVFSIFFYFYKKVKVRFTGLY
jgi:hypothetical protein